ncbi:MAG TPA: hypothetical protein VJ385_13520 [Fibrobacteria bacterium]|nr:hypothetical protein [Fibrobacteria bacterium]
MKQSIERLDALLAAETSEEKIRAGMGVRLALGMAQELKAGKPLGSETAGLVADWAAHYGKDSVDAAVKIAREFLVKPDAMRTVLGRKLGLEPGGEADDGGDGDGASADGDDPDFADPRETEA